MDPESTLTGTGRDGRLGAVPGPAEIVLPLAALTRVLAWLSPAFPTGAFAYSHGLEAAVEAGRVRTSGDLAAWVAGLVERGAGRTDGILACAVWRAVTAGDRAGFVRLAELADASRPTAELALETRAQGTAFLATVAAAWDPPGLDPYRAALAAAGREPALPVAVALAGALASVPLVPLLAAYLGAFAGSLVSAGVRLVPLGQTDGQRAQAALDPVVRAAAAGLPGVPLGDLGAATPLAEILSMHHETQYTRLFRS